MEPPSSTSHECDLVERARGGDHQAFAELVARHDDRLRALAYRLLGTSDQLDDALQEAYLRAFRSIRRFRGDSTFATWLHRITHNACLDLLRRRVRPAAALDAVELASPAPGPAERAVASIEATEVLARLTPAVRATVLLVHGYGFDHAGASALLRVPAGTVASRLHRARSQGVTANAA